MNLYFSLVAIVLSFSAGAYADHEFNLAAQTKQAFQRIGVAQQGEANIIQADQKLDKDIEHDKKDPCLNGSMPADISKQLR
jgi:hypothetical protein